MKKLIIENKTFDQIIDQIPFVIRFKVRIEGYLIVFLYIMKKKINTIMTPDDNELTMKRAKYTKDFIRKHIKELKLYKCLDIGYKSPVGDYITKFLQFDKYNTNGNLDYKWKAEKEKYDIVLCTETLEHLVNPGTFLTELKKYITKDTYIFITYPSRPKFMWTDQHFHEYDKKRYEYLIKTTGYKIIDHEIKQMPRSFLSCLKGIRPFIRLFWNPDNLYLVKIK